MERGKNPAFISLLLSYKFQKGNSNFLTFFRKYFFRRGKGEHEVAPPELVGKYQFCPLGSPFLYPVKTMWDG